jgi:hypothetical protein
MLSTVAAAAGAILIPLFCAFSNMYESLCHKCLHPMEVHNYVVAQVDGREVRRCEVGVCTCIVMAKKQ